MSKFSKIVQAVQNPSFQKSKILKVQNLQSKISKLSKIVPNY